MPPSSLRVRPDAGEWAWKTGALFLALAFFVFVEPAEWLLCPFRRLTGLPCPLCGLTHALCAIGHGQFRRAVELHAVSPAIFALFVAGFLASLARWCGLPPPRSVPSQARVFTGLFVLLLGYWAWRLVSLIT